MCIGVCVTKTAQLVILATLHPRESENFIKKSIFLFSLTLLMGQKNHNIYKDSYLYPTMIVKLRLNQVRRTTFLEGLPQRDACSTTINGGKLWK